MKFSFSNLSGLLKQNWKAGLTVALISVPLSIALSVASGAGPVPGVIAGIWATVIAGFFGGSNYNIIGAAGALTTVLFAATLAAPSGLGAAALPLIALASGIIILFIWLIRADRFLYYIPSSIMYGFAGGVAFLIAASQLFDATGLSALKRTGTFIGDVALYVAHSSDTSIAAVSVFAAFLVFILVWKRFIKKLPAVIPAAALGIVFGYITESFFPGTGLITLGDKFGSFAATLVLPVAWDSIPLLFAGSDALGWLFATAGTVALISVLETLITAQIGDKITKTQSSTRKELLGLGLANLGSGAMGGLPATGVFIRTGANIKAGATHKVSAILAAVFTAGIALIILPFFIYIPMAVIAAILVNTALGLIETHKFVEFWKREKLSFAIAILVLAVTVLEDAGLAVVIGAVLSLLFFADNVSHGYFDVVFNYKNGERKDERRAKVLRIPDTEPMAFVTYSIAGFLGYIDAPRHATNFRHLARAKNIPVIIIRLRNLFSIDYEGEDMLVEAIKTLNEHRKSVYLTSCSQDILEGLMKFPEIVKMKEEGRIFVRSEEAIRAIEPSWKHIWHGDMQHATVSSVV